MSWSRSVTIERPPSDTWVAFTTIARRPDIHPGIASCKWVVGSTLQLGSSFMQVRQGAKASGSTQVEVAAVEPWRSFTLAFPTAGCRVTYQYDFVPDGAWTRVTLTAAAEAGSLRGRLTCSRVLQRLQRLDGEHLEDAKRLLEAPRTVAAPLAGSPVR